VVGTVRTANRSNEGRTEPCESTKAATGSERSKANSATVEGARRAHQGTTSYRGSEQTVGLVGDWLGRQNSERTVVNDRLVVQANCPRCDAERRTQIVIVKL